MSNVDTIIDQLVAREGGYTNNPADRGGPTRYGITEVTARANGYGGDMRDLPLDTAKRIYRGEYWIRPRFDLISTISSPVADELLDTGVNCGTAFARPLLQRALNLLNNQGALGYEDLAVDGVLGAKTQAALRVYLRKRGKEGEQVLLRVLNILQGERYISIAEARPTQETFFYGWILNRVAL